MNLEEAFDLYVPDRYFSMKWATGSDGESWYHATRFSTGHLMLSRLRWSPAPTLPAGGFWFGDDVEHVPEDVDWVPGTYDPPAEAQAKRETTEEGVRRGSE